MHLRTWHEDAVKIFATATQPDADLAGRSTRTVEASRTAQFMSSGCGRARLRHVARRVADTAACETPVPGVVAQLGAEPLHVGLGAGMMFSSTLHLETDAETAA